MLFEQIKLKIVSGTVALLAAGTVISCSNSQKELAEQILVKADLALADGNYCEAIQFLDSLDSIYPKEIDVRRRSLHLRPRALELQIVAQSAQVDSMLSVLILAGDSLQQELVKVDHPLEPYYVVKDRAGKSVVGSTGIEARVMPDGTMYLISSLSGKKINHVSLTAVSGNETASTASIPLDGERNDRSMGYEVIHFMPMESAEFCKFVSQRSDVAVVFNGESGQTYRLELTPEDVKGIATVYNSSENLRERHRLILERQKLEKQLELSRRQQASTLSDD